MHTDGNNNTGLESGRQVIAVPVDEVEPRAQVRKQFRNIEALADSLLVEGQQSPIIVYPRNSSGKYLIQKGERRWRACKYAGLPTIDIIVNDHTQSELDQTAGALIENIQREDLTAMEIASALKQFTDQGWKQVEVAKRLGKSEKFVSAHLGLLRLPGCVMELYEAGLCTDTDTLNTLRQLYERSPEKCVELCQEAHEQGIHRKRARSLLNALLLEQESTPHDSRTTSGSSLTIPAIRPITRPQAPSGLQVPWLEAQPEELRFIAQVIRGEHRRQSGMLLTDRISKSGRKAWLQPESGSSRLLCVDVSSLKLIRIEKAKTDT